MDNLRYFLAEITERSSFNTVIHSIRRLNILGVHTETTLSLVNIDPGLNKDIDVQPAL